MVNILEICSDEIISCYTRSEAIADGELVDLAPFELQRCGLLEGFKVPIAITSALYNTLNDFHERSGEDIFLKDL